MKDATYKMINLALETGDTAAIEADAETVDRASVDSSLASAPLQGDHPGGIDGEHGCKPTVRIMSMTWIPTCGGTACCGERPPDYGKPILTIGEAARLIGVSKKRMETIIFEEKRQLGRLPDFVCDAGGKIQRRVLTDELMAWVKSRRIKRGRPSKSQARD